MNSRRVLPIQRACVVALTALLPFATGRTGVAAPLPAGASPDTVRLPAATGPSPVGLLRATLTDSTRVDPAAAETERPRRVTATIWYPALPGTGEPAAYVGGLGRRGELLGPALTELVAAVRTDAREAAIPATAGTRAPVVLFSHSLGGLPEHYAGLGVELASHGYVVASIGHPDGAGPLLLVDGTVTRMDPAWQANDPAEVGIEAAFAFRESRTETWARDALFVLRSLPRLEVNGRRPFADAVDTTRVAYAGHSVGGSAAALGCSIGDALDACVNLDGWPVAASVESDGLARPYLHVEETRPYRSAEQLDEWGATRERYDRNMASLAARKDSLLQAMRAPAYHLVIDGLEHAGFSDRPVWDPSAAQAQELDAARGLFVLRRWLRWFLDRHVRGDRTARPPDPPEYPEVRFTAYGKDWSQDRPAGERAAATPRSGAEPSVTGGNPSSRAPWRGLTPDEWREDLAYLAEHLRLLHADAFHSLPEAAFEARVRELERRIPELEDDRIVVELARLVTAVGDGHTRISVSANLRERRYPLWLRLFPEGLHVIAAPDPLRALLGARVLSIDETPIQEALAALEPITAADNPMNRRQRLPENLVVPVYLHGLGIAASADSVRFTLEDDSGRVRTAVLRPAAAGGIAWRFVHERLEDPPTWLRRAGARFHYEYLPEGGILYAQVNAIRNGPDRSLAEFYRDVVDRAAEPDVERLVLDLRLNGGGDNTLNWPLIYGLIRSGWAEREGRLFTLIGRQTFSAAGHLATVLERHTNTVFIGEPTGAAPNHYGDARPFHLPNSGIRVGASTLFWQNSLAWDDRPWVPPDVAAVLSWDDYRSGRDPALEAVRAYAPQPPLADRLRAALEAGGLAAVREAAEAVGQDPAHRWADVEGALNAIGYGLLWDEGPDAAIPVFRLNAELHPGSANVWDSLAEAHVEAGRDEEAARLYRRALSIDPKLPSAIIALEDLRR